MTTLAALSPRDRDRLAARMREPAGFGRVHAERGQQRPAPEPVPLHRAATYRTGGADGCRPVNGHPVRQYHAWYRHGMWTVAYLPEAEQERGKLPGRERAAMHNAVRKLESLGPALGYPHTSDVRGTPGLRELRPRAGRSPWRALYRQVGESFVIAAVGPEAQHDPHGFTRACAAAQARLAELEE